MTEQEQRDNEKKVMQAFSAQLFKLGDDIYTFVYEVHKGSIYANHQMGVAISNIRYAARQLLEQAGK